MNWNKSIEIPNRTGYILIEKYPNRNVTFRNDSFEMICMKCQKQNALSVFYHKNLANSRNFV